MALMSYDEWLKTQRNDRDDRRMAMDRVGLMLESSLMMLDDLGLHQVAGHVDMGLQLLTQQCAALEPA